MKKQWKGKVWLFMESLEAVSIEMKLYEFLDLDIGMILAPKHDHLEIKIICMLLVLAYHSRIKLSSSVVHDIHLMSYE
jgi:hypothetical protein